MTNNHINPDNFQLTPVEPPKRNPQQVVAEVVAYIKSGITLAFYLIAATIVLGVAYVVVRVTIWAADTIVKAVGL